MLNNKQKDDILPNIFDQSYLSILTFFCQHGFIKKLSLTYYFIKTLVLELY